MVTVSYWKNSVSGILDDIGEIDVTLTWIKDDDLQKYQPYFQVYGICFNDKNEILIINEDKAWKIPGGHPEASESAEETLKRKLIEEADVEVSECIPLGAQQIDFPNNPNAKEGKEPTTLRSGL